MTLSPGTRLDGYEILSLIGSDGMGKERFLDECPV
jgi:hypothetical protein